MIADGNLMRQMNLNKVRWVMRGRGDLSKPEISRETGLSVVTVNALVAELVKTGEVLPVEAREGGNGRPAMRYVFNDEYSRGIALCVRAGEGRQIVLSSVVNRRGKEIARENYGFARVGKEELRQIIAGAMEQYSGIRTAAIGLPGPVKDNRLVFCDFPVLDEGDLAEELERDMGITVKLECDINLAIQGYSERVGLSEEGCAVGLYFPEDFCMGCGVYLLGQVWSGRRGMAGELSALPVNRRPKGELTVREFTQCVKENVRMLTALLDPDEVVVYCKDASAYAGVGEQMSGADGPRVVFSDQYEQDYRRGAARLVLSELEPGFVLP